MSTSKGNEILAMIKKMESLQRENEELKKHQYVPPGITFSITEHGLVAIHGLGKYYVQLFPDEVYRLLDHEKDLRKFIDDNKDKLSWRNKP